MRQDVLSFQRRIIKIGVTVVLGLSFILLWLPAGMLKGVADAPLESVSSELAIHLVCPVGPPDCDYKTIQAAVDAANDGDVIKVAAGVYTGVNTYGGLSQVVYISKSVTIQGGYDTNFTEIPDAEAYPTVIDAGQQGRTMYITGNISPMVKNLSLTGGNASGLGGGQWGYDVGGGVYISKAVVTISNAKVFSNTAQDGGGLFLYESNATLNQNTVVSNVTTIFGAGGGIYLYKSDATLSRNTIFSNIAHTDGGGLFVYESSALLNGNTISFNKATQNHGGGARLYYSTGIILNDNIISHNTADYGGGLALWHSEVITLNRNIITANTAFSAGGILFYGSSGILSDNIIGDNQAYWNGSGLVVANSQAMLENNTITANQADLDGGGIFLEASQVTLDKNTISANAADRGGGMLIYTTTATLSNNIIVDNRANSAGSGVSIWAAQVDLLHNTFGNNWGQGGGVYVSGYLTSWGETWYSTVTLTNTILSGHQTGLNIVPGNEVSMAGTIWFDNDQNWEGEFTHQDDYNGSPDFVSEETGDYHLEETSVAVDQGQSTSVVDDIDGEARPFGMTPDIGADEFHPQPDLNLSKRASSTFIMAGERLTYTLYLTNIGNVSLQAVITDTLPYFVESGHTLEGSLIIPGGVLVWGPTIIEVGETWTQTVGVTVTKDYSGQMENDLWVATKEGIEKSYTNIVKVIKPGIYLPLILR